MMRTSIAARVLDLRRVAERSWTLHRLGRQRDRVAGSIVHVIQSVLRHALTPEERVWVEAIERLRAEMNASTTRITWTDYGAGAPGANREVSTMRAGVEMTQPLGDVCRVVSKSPFWCSFLFRFVRTFRPTSCIEMGTALGISAAYQAAALTLNGQGMLATLEGAASLAGIARENFRRLGLDTVEVTVGRFADTLGDVLARRQPVDYVFVDGHHDGQATVAYFEQAVPFLAETGFVIFDDIAWSDGMTKAWRTIVGDERVRLAVDLGAMGLCVVSAAMAGHRHFKVSLH